MISIFFTCQVSACELLPFSCHDLANHTKSYSQTAKTVGMITTVRVGACKVLYIYLGSPILAGSPLQPTLNYWGP